LAARELRHLLRQCLTMAIYLLSFRYRCVRWPVDRKGVSHLAHPDFWLVAESASDARADRDPVVALRAGFRLYRASRDALALTIADVLPVGSVPLAPHAVGDQLGAL
jgi:hypothetical protein